MSDQHNHDHPAVDVILVKRLRFLKLSLDTLLLPDNPNREQAYKAALRMLEVIGVTNAEQPASVAMNGWVFAKELVSALEPDITAELLPEEVAQFFLRVEALAEMPLDGREEEWAKEQARLNELSLERPVAGLVRLLMLCKTVPRRHRDAFLQLGVKPEELAASQHLINKDLADWKAMNLKPHWFTDEFLVFRDTEADRAELGDEARKSRALKEQDLVMRLLSVRHQSPEGSNLIRFYKKRIDDETAKLEKGEETNAGT